MYAPPPRTGYFLAPLDAWYAVAGVRGFRTPILLGLLFLAVAFLFFAHFIVFPQIGSPTRYPSAMERDQCNLYTHTKGPKT